MASFSEEMLQALSNHDMVEANIKFENALKSDTSEVLAGLGEELNNAGFLEEAKIIFEQLIEQHPEEAGLYISLAEIEVENDRIKEALELLDKVSTDHPSYPEALLVAADLYQVLDLPEVSEKKLIEAKELLPEEPVIDFALAELYFSTEKMEAAIERYKDLEAQGIDRIMEVNLDDRLGAALGLVGEFEEAIAYLERAMEEEQTDDRLLQLGITYIQVGERVKAISLLQQLRTLNPTYYQLYLPLASALADEQLYEEALQVLNEGIKEHPYNIAQYELYSDIAYGLHQFDEAEEILRDALKVDHENEFLLIKLGNLLVTQERYEDALDVVSGLKESDLSQAYWTLAQSYNGLEEFEQASVYFDKAFEGLHDEPDFLKEYGFFLREDGRMNKAKQVLQQYFELTPEDMEVASLLEEMGWGK